MKRLADPGQRKSEVLEERNAIAVFSRPEVAGTPGAVSVLKPLAVYTSRELRRERSCKRLTKLICIIHSELTD